jgi:hypothetical protein
MSNGGEEEEEEVVREVDVESVTLGGPGCGQGRAIDGSR